MKPSFKFEYHWRNVLTGGVIYCAGDTIAALIESQLDWKRTLGMLFLGATLYAFEIPNWFRWIDTRTVTLEGLKATVVKTALATLYFNPLWIARHLFFVQLFAGHFRDVTADIVKIAGLSFVVTTPVAIVVNCAVQNVAPLKWRFLLNALFSGILALFFALSNTLFAF